MTLERFQSHEKPKDIVVATNLKSNLITYIKRGFMLEILLKLFFPSKCIFCDNSIHINEEVEICDQCYSRIKLYNYNSGKPKMHLDFLKYGDGIISVCKYSGLVKESLRKFKFQQSPHFYRTFSNLLYNTLKPMLVYMQLDMVLSVPLHNKRLVERGYNQAYLISKNISKRLDLKEGSRYLKRIKETKTQSLLKKDERTTNVKNSFKILKTKEISGKNILIIDDILTTGNTLEECAKVLKESGAKNVFLAVIATGKSL
jgi:competence protein ComFC